VSVAPVCAESGRVTRVVLEKVIRRHRLARESSRNARLAGIGFAADSFARRGNGMKTQAVGAQS
jgi:hypothetical protein